MSDDNHESMPMLAPFPMLTFDPSGQETLVYGTDSCVAAMGAEPAPIGFGQRTGVGQWNVEEIVDEIGWSPDMAMDDAGHTYIAYFDEDENLRYAHNRSGVWQVITVSAKLPKNGGMQ